METESKDLLIAQWFQERVLMDKIGGYVVRAFRNRVTGLWTCQGYMEVTTLQEGAFDDIEPDVRDRLGVLLTAPVGFRHEDIGRRVDEDVFWVFVKPKGEQE